jgi:DNA-binding response OmpR family regulator
MSFEENDVEEFRIEAGEMLDQAEADLIKIDQGGDFKSLYDSVFRVFHSLKGGAGMLGLEPLQKHMHALEGILSGLKGSAKISSAESTFFLTGVDAARILLSGQAIEFEYTVRAPTPEAAVNNPTPAPARSIPLSQANLNSKGLAYLVDDEPDVLESLEGILNDAQITTEAFGDAHAALARFKEKPCDVILTDLKMPKMNGIQFLQAVRQIDPDVPVIIVSAFIDVDSLMAAIQAGVHSAVTKPFQIHALSGAVLSAIRQQRTAKMFKKGLNLLLYQFADLEDFLKANGKEDIAKSARTELNQLMTQWKELNI